MVELSRKKIRVLRVMMRQALRITTSRGAPVVTFRAGPGELLIQAATARIALECRLQAECAPEVFAIPYEALVACEGREDTPVTIEKRGDIVSLAWTDAGIPQSVEFPAHEPAEMPETPSVLAAVGPGFLPAMADAAATTDADATRFAMGCVRLRGSDGQIAATDGRQALVQTGFPFPWQEALLVPASRAFASKEFASAREVVIGRSEDWVFIRAGCWTLSLRIDKEARFPAIDDQIPAQGADRATVSLSEEDAAFFLKAARRLPAASDSCAPLTVDLNGAVVIRAKAAEQATPTELLLRNSSRTGEEMRFSTNREHLARALELGFREIHLRSAEAPALCRDERRAYLWALLGNAGALKPDGKATRIESPLTVHNASHRRSTNIPMKPTIPETPVHAGESKPAPSILTQAEALRDSLSQALNTSRELIAAIKQRRKQSQLVESTLRSLKQLENLDA